MKINMVPLRLLLIAFFSSLFVSASTMHAAEGDSASAGANDHEVYEVRTILLDEHSDVSAIDGYLERALVPALRRHGAGPVGVLHPTAADETGLNAIFVIIPLPSADDVNRVREALAGDEAFAAAAAEYLNRDHNSPPYKRLRSELLVSMDCWPKAIVPEDALSNDQRVFELRLYESANERLGDLKVEMFNAGEVPIFLDCNITPVFIGQCLIGPQMPSLTYLTVYENDAARQQAWQAFRDHPDWKVLSKNPKYGGTVSRIDKFVLQAKPYSQM